MTTATLLTDNCSAHLLLDGWAGRHLLLDGWAGRRRVPVEVLSETPTRYRVRLEQGAMLPRRGYCDAGTVLLAPKHAVVIDKETTDHD